MTLSGITTLSGMTCVLYKLGGLVTAGQKIKISDCGPGRLYSVICSTFLSRAFLDHKKLALQGVKILFGVNKV